MKLTGSCRFFKFIPIFFRFIDPDSYPDFSLTKIPPYLPPDELRSLETNKKVHDKATKRKVLRVGGNSHGSKSTRDSEQDSERSETSSPVSSVREESEGPPEKKDNANKLLRVKDKKPKNKP